MVRLLNYDEQSNLGADLTHYARRDAATLAIGSDDRLNPNLNGFTAALSCYPIVSQLATYLDLTTLSEIAQTCRQVRADLLQYKDLLKSQTLRCSNEHVDPAARLGTALHASHEIWTAYGRNGVKLGRITSGKVGTCARDMVGQCRSCGTVICRNCIIKAPPTEILKRRHRRLCRTCMKAPFDRLTTVTRAIGADIAIPRFGGDDHARTSPAEEEFRTFFRTPCTCNEAVWICQPCGQTLRADDTTYMRGWNWRTRYSHCGGMGAGLGEGNEGVECGRSRDCLAARLVEQDVECDFAELAALQAETEKSGMRWNGSSYSTQEIMGIGGKVKTKVKRRVFVGAIVKEYEDEREGRAEFCGKEQSGANRSWCSWCERVITGKKDAGEAARSTDSLLEN